MHCAYWKYTVRRRILGQKRDLFPLKGSNWFVVDSPIATTHWQELVKVLDNEHRALRATLENAPWAKLTVGPGGGPGKPAARIYGVAMHDLYHAGQIQTLKALQKRAK